MSAEAGPDELEMLEIEDEPPEEANEIQDDQPASFEGPRTWEEVEENESQRVSLNISTHAVPSNDSGEAAARLAWQAAALEADSQDPLGMGRIDAHGLRLVSASVHCTLFQAAYLSRRNRSQFPDSDFCTCMHTCFCMQVRQERAAARFGMPKRNVSVPSGALLSTQLA